MSDPNVIFSDAIEILRPAESVWAVLTDFAAYGAWNPLCRAISVIERLGGQVLMVIDDPRTGGQTDLVYNIAAFESPGRLAWESHFAELALTARRDQLIQKLDDQRCVYFTTDLYSGDGAEDAFAQNAEWVRDEFNRMARALKQRVEAC